MRCKYYRDTETGELWRFDGQFWGKRSDYYAPLWVSWITGLPEPDTLKRLPRLEELIVYDQ